MKVSWIRGRNTHTDLLCVLEELWTKKKKTQTAKKEMEIQRMFGLRVCNLVTYCSQYRVCA